MSSIYNFNAGPSILPREVLEEAQRDLLDFQSSGISILESSHRGEAYEGVHMEAMQNIAELCGLTDEYAVLLLQGGATGQFAWIPMNLLGPNDVADYVNTGSWAAKAIEQASCLGNVHVAADSTSECPARVPTAEELNFSPNAAYLHLTSNETIGGTQWPTYPVCDAPIVVDMSSDILSRPVDYTAFDLVYAGAQKNLGIAGVSIVIIRKALADRAPDTLPGVLRYRDHIQANSLLHTAPCFSVYITMLVTRWLKATGIERVYQNNHDKASRLYGMIDSTDFYRGPAATHCRSKMNVTFSLANEALESEFLDKASRQGMLGLKGHRSVGGIRASIYNAFPVDGVDALVSFMKDFENSHS